MKRTIKNLLTCLLVVAVSACSDDFLDLQPEQSIANEQFLLTVDDFQAAMYGGYNHMQLADWYGRYMLLIPDIMGEDVKPNASANRGAAWALYQGAPTTVQNEHREFWQEIYQAIDQANRMINADFTPPESRATEFNQLLGEAYALRALGHFDLVRLFSQHYTFTAGASHPGVPIVTQFDIEAKPGRPTVAEVYGQIIDDFQQAINLMTVDPANRNVFSREAAQALLARVYLYMEDFSNAEAMANEVINSGKFALVGFNDYPTMFLTGNSSEAIMEVEFNPTDNPGADHIGGMYKETGYGDYLPAQDLLGLFEGNDVRGTMFTLDPNLDGGIYASADGLGRRTSKFPSAGSDIGSDNVPVIRLAEVMLIRAEARMRKAGPDQVGALADLNTLRLRADPSANELNLTGDALLAEIMLERRRELCFEGHRIFDLTRTQQGLLRTDCTADGACDIAYPNDRFILAIPQAELDANPNMQQNPGYGI